MWSLLDRIDNVWTLISLLVFAFALGGRTVWSVLGGRKRLTENDQRDASQQRQIDDLADRVALLNQFRWLDASEIGGMLKEWRGKKNTVKRRAK